MNNDIVIEYVYLQLVHDFMKDYISEFPKRCYQFRMAELYMDYIEEMIENFRNTYPAVAEIFHIDTTARRRKHRPIKYKEPRTKRKRHNRYMYLDNAESRKNCISFDFIMRHEKPNHEDGRDKYIFKISNGNYGMRRKK